MPLHFFVNHKLRRALILLFLILLSMPAYLHAEEAAKTPKILTIGSKAPELDVEHWVSDGEGKFKKVTAFEKDKIYVVEFWATWCGPCIASMPHIVDMQKTYADKGVQIVSVSNEELEKVQMFLERKVPQAENEITFAELTKSYCLTADPDGSTSKDYMRAAGQNGIPCAFVVGKTGLIEWIGHPMSMDKTLASVVDDKWDREAFAIAFKQEQEFDLAMAEISSLARNKKYDEALELTRKINSSGNKQIEDQKLQILISLLISANKHEEALGHIEKILETNPEDSSRYLFLKVRAMLSIKGKEAEAIALVKTILEDEKQALQLKVTLFSQISGSIIEGTLTNPETAKQTITLGDALLEKIKGDSAVRLLVSLSALAAHLDDSNKAIAYLEKAIEFNTNPRVKTILDQRLDMIKKEVNK